MKSVIIDKVAFDGQPYDLTQPAERNALIKAIDTYIRYAPSVAEREVRLAQVQDALGVALPRRVTGNLAHDAALPLGWEQIHEMEASGLISFGAHTVHHPILGFLADASEVRREVIDARSLLEEHLGHPVYCFAYPVGKMQHIGEQGLQAVQDAGYKWAVTTLEAENTAQTHHHLLNRYPGDVSVHWLVMAAELAGLLGVVSRFRKKYAKFFRK